MLALALALSTAHFAPTADTAAVAPVTQELRLELAPGQPGWSGALRARITVRRATRRFTLLLAGATPARVELTDARGAVRLTWGWVGRDTLLVETAAPLSPGAAGLDVEWSGRLASPSRGPREASPGTIALDPGAGGMLPLWPGEPRATPWRVTVIAPDTCDVRCSLPARGGSRAGRWRAWEFASARPLPADSLALSVRARPARRPGKPGGTARQGRPAGIPQPR